MRSTDQQVQTSTLFMSYSAPYIWNGIGVQGWITGTNPWVIRLTEPGAKLVSLDPHGSSPGAPSGTVVALNPDWSPQQGQVQFLTPGGAGGGLGGEVTVHWRKLA